MKLVAYLRVSTDSQLDGSGFDVQRQTVKAWAKANGHRIVAWHVDEAVSGTLAERDALADALADVTAKRAAGVVVPRLDRLARDLIVQETLLAEFGRVGEVFSCTPSETAFIGDDPDDPTRKLIRQIMGALSEWERSMIALRLRKGRRQKASRGGYAYGSPPFGMEAHARELVAVDNEQAAIARAVELHAGGASLRTIAELLAAEGFATKRGGAWHPNTVRRVLGRAA